MASSGKKKTTMAKLNREAKMREKRLDKQARKEARKYAAAHPEEAAAAQVDENGDPVAPAAAQVDENGDPLAPAARQDASPS
ncbi:MAG: hypothetical protein ACR2LK_15465 [Solirubrobacteraceae bacterium]